MRYVTLCLRLIHGSLEIQAFSRFAQGRDADQVSVLDVLIFSLTYKIRDNYFSRLRFKHQTASFSSA